MDLCSQSSGATVPAAHRLKKWIENEIVLVLERESQREEKAKALTGLNSTTGIG